MAGYIGTTAVSLSTTAAVVTGDMAVDTNTLYVDSTNNRVGIGTSSPSTTYSPKLHVKSSNSDGKGGILVTNYRPSIIFEDVSGGTPAGIQIEADGGALKFLADTNQDGTFNQEHMRIDSSGNLLVGKTSADNTTQGARVYSTGRMSLVSEADEALSLNRRTTDGTIASFRKTGATVGTISVTGSATAYNTSSDYRLKEAWVPMTGASARVQALNPINFAWKVDGSRVDGFLAHELAEVTPEAVTGTKDAMKDEEYEVTPAIEATYAEDGTVLTEAVPAVMGTRSVPDMQAIDQSKIVPLLTAALQEALTEIAALKVRVAALEVTP